MQIPELSFSLKGSYSMPKGAAMCAAPIGSPRPLDDSLSIAFSNYLQFPLVPPAKLPRVAFSNYIQFPNIRHWDQNYIFSMFCHHRYVFCFVNPYFLAGIAAFVEILLLAVSKPVLKRSQKRERLSGPDLLFSWTFAPGGRLSHEAYNVVPFKMTF